MTVKQYTLSQITAKLGGEVRGEDVSVYATRSLTQTGVEHISLLANPKYKHGVHDSRTGAVIVSDKTAGEFTGHNLAVTADPYPYFAKVAYLFSPVVKARGDVHLTAVVKPSAIVPDNCEIGADVYIGANIILGEGCCILVSAVIQRDCKLSSEVVLHPNAMVYYDCTLGGHVEIHGDAVIGANGFGLALVGDSWFKIPQIGVVTLGDNVEIGSSSNIDRGAMSDTAVGNGTKIDNQVQIGYNCKTGSHTAIAAKTDISGSVTVGNHCTIGGGIGTAGHIEIVDKTAIGGGTSVTHSITAISYTHLPSPRDS